MSAHHSASRHDADQNSEMAMNTVSVLVPVYRVEPFFDRCLRSLFAQTYQDIEFVFVNDCTPDNSMGLLKDYCERYPDVAARVKVIENERNMGIAPVRNRLLDNATGDYVLFVDSDDWIETDMVEVLVRKAQATGADMVGCDYYEDYPDRSEYRRQTYPESHEQRMRDMTLLRIKGVLWKLLVRRSLFEENHIRFVEDIHFGEDYILCCKLFALARHVESVSKALYHYVQYNPNNYSNSSDANIDSLCRAIRSVETCYREQGLLPLLEKELLQRKFILKSVYVIDARRRDLRRWGRLFPESNWSWKGLGYGRANRLLFAWAALLHSCRQHLPSL